MQHKPDTISLIAETATVEKRDVVTGRVKVSTQTETHTDMISAVLDGEDVEVTRVAVNRDITESPPIRTEGDVTILPVVEEVLFVEKRLVLREELHVRRIASKRAVEIPVQLRKQHAVIERDGQSTQRQRGTAKMSQITDGSNRTLTALFDSMSEAQRAVERLVDAGIPKDAVRLVPGYESDTPSPDRGIEHRGFFGALADFFMPDEDRYSYAEGLTRGGYLVAVNDLSDALHDTAVDILDDEGSIDLDEREESWRSEGWNGYTANAPDRTGERATTGASTYEADRVFGNSQATRAAGEDETIPVVDERLVVGKRDVNLGRVRVRSYIRQEPVSTDVNLHDERVTIDRRSVDRPVADADRAFQTRSIEAEEHAEQAVVGKEARVTEEISLRRDGADRTETVNDTVRKTEVEVEDDRDLNNTQRQNQR